MVDRIRKHFSVWGRFPGGDGSVAGGSVLQERVIVEQHEFVQVVHPVARANFAQHTIHLAAMFADAPF
jgi:hypothetical protein